MDRCCGLQMTPTTLLGVCITCAHLTLRRAALQAQPVRDRLGVWSCPKFERVEPRWRREA